MKFLFFDLECARTDKGGKGIICEFGYVLTDERFEVLEKNVLLVAPEKQFIKFVIEDMLSFKLEEYEAAPNFAGHYEKIKALFEGEDVVVVGHTVDGDARCLNYAAQRYELPYINFEFYDLRKIFMHRRKTTASSSLKFILEDLNLEFVGHMHRSDDDAYATMLAFKELCRLSGTDGAAFIEEYAPFKGATADGRVTKAKVPPFALTEEEKEERAEKRKELHEQKSKVKRQRRILESFLVYNTTEEYNFHYLTRLANSDVEYKNIENYFDGKKFCIDRDYQKTHFKEMISLIWLIRRHGGKCIFYPNQCDIFVNGVPEGYPRKFEKYLRTAERKNAQIITLSELLDVFKVTEEDLYKMPFPPYGAFERKKREDEDK